jgi:hypothetical protein
MLAVQAAVPLGALVADLRGGHLRPARQHRTRGLTNWDMPEAPNFGSLDVTDFTVGAMLRAGIAIRRAVRGSPSLETAANRVVGYLYEHCVGADGARSCVLVRFYKTHPYGDLEPAQQRFAAAELGAIPPRQSMRCLTLVASMGEELAWTSRHTSRSHLAIPLPSAESIRTAPMIVRLVEDLGVDIERLVSSAPEAVRGTDTRTYDVFHVEEARASPHIPVQTEFVERYGIRSVVGFGGLLRTGELFAVILFSRHHIPVRSATRFRTIALDVRSALFRVDEGKTWETEGSSSAATQG